VQLSRNRGAEVRLFYGIACNPITLFEIFLRAVTARVKEAVRKLRRGALVKSAPGPKGFRPTFSATETA